MAEGRQGRYLNLYMSDSSQLPPKPDVALALLQTATSVYVHLDPRGPDVSVPAWFKKQPQLVLQVGLNMAVPIPDLDVGHTALSCTLSFNRRPEFCRIPWTAIYGLVGDDGRGMIWPESIPPEVATATEGSKAAKSVRPHLRLAHSDRASAPAPSAAGEGSDDGLDESAAAIDELPPGVAPARVETDALSAGAAAQSLPSGVDDRAQAPQTSAPESPRQLDRAAGATSRPSRPSGRPSGTPSERKLPPYLRVVK